MTQALLSLRDGAVARLRMNRPELHNAFDAGLIAQLTHELEQAGADSRVRVVVLEGAGASFSAGADLNWMRGMAAASEAENRDDALALARLMRVLDELPRPTLARVHGAAFGGGVGLVACCDIAIGVAEAKFGLTESKLGLLPAVISPYVLPKIGPSAARELFLTGMRFSAARAREIGLVHRVVATRELDAEVGRCLDEILTAAPSGVAASKALIPRVWGRAPADAMAITAEAIAAQRVSPEGQEGLRAFLAKQKPGWTIG